MYKGCMTLLTLMLIVLVYTVCCNKSQICHDETVGIVCMMKDPKSLDTWIDHHIDKGVSRFYIRLEDTPSLQPYLSKHPKVFLEVGSPNDHPTSISDEWEFGTAQMQRQCDWVDRSIGRALLDGIRWLIHIDADELIECRGRIQDHICNEIGSHIKCIKLKNYEAKYADIPKETDSCFQHSKLLDCTRSQCTSYANGKGMGRVVPGLLSHGVHEYKYKNDHTQYEMKGVHIIHYESCDFDRYVQKFKDLSIKDDPTSAFNMYNESIRVVKSEDCSNMNSTVCLDKLKEVYIKYKVDSLK